MIKFVVTILLIFTVFANRNVNSKEPHIAGGLIAKKNQFPFFAQLSLKNPVIGALPEKATCGASLIQPQWIVSAAHCFEQYMQNIEYFINTDYFVVYMGTNIRYNPHAYLNNISEVYLHPKYHTTDDISGKMLKNDVAIVRLKKAYILGKYIQTIYLAPEIENFSTWRKHCNPGMVIGIGEVDEDIYPNYVLYAHADINYHGESSQLSYILRPETNIFTLSKQLIGHTMKGVSGGPFVCYDNRQPVLYGISSTISEGVHTNRKVYGTVGTYERIDKHLDFISEYVPGAIIY